MSVSKPTKREREILRRLRDERITRKAPNPPYGKWLKVEGSPVKKVRFRKGGNVDVVIVPRSRNESYRKVKKQVRKLQRSGALEPGPMFQKFRKAAGISKKGRKRNPAGRWRVKKIKDFYGKTAYLVTKGPSHTFGKFSKKEDAQKRADELNYGGSSRNPLVSTPTTFHHRLGKYQLLPKRVHSDGTVDFLYSEGGIGQDFSVGPQGGIVGRLPPFAHGNAKKLARIAREQDR